MQLTAHHDDDFSLKSLFSARFSRAKNQIDILNLDRRINIFLLFGVQHSALLSHKKFKLSMLIHHGITMISSLIPTISKYVKVAVTMITMMMMMMAIMIGSISFVDGFSSSSLSLSSSSPSSSPIPPPPPISVPVWSFATSAATKETATLTTSMNIMTFCMPVSVSSPKLWALSFYHGTLTKDSFLGGTTRNNNNNDGDNSNNDDTNISKNENDNNSNKTNTGVLQLLTYSHAQLVKVLGKKSGRDINKSIGCQEAGFPWWNKTTTMDKKNTKKKYGNNTTGNDCTQQQLQSTCSSCIDFDLLPGCALYIQVEWQPSSSQLIDAGDHVVAICEVKRTGIWKQEDKDDVGQVLWSDDELLNDEEEAMFLRLRSDGLDESNALYSGRLRKEGII
jgi:hypothetical protein